MFHPPDFGVPKLTHWLQLTDQLLLGPLLLVAPQREVGRDHGHLVVVRVRHVQIVHQHNVRILEQPVAAPMKGGQDGRMDVAAVDALRTLHLQLHVVFARRFAVLALLPAVAVAPVAHLFARVQQHRAAFRSAAKRGIENEKIPSLSIKTTVFSVIIMLYQFLEVIE